MAKTTTNSSRVGESSLSQRLLRLKHLAHPHSKSIWDISCDHGLLGLSFLHQTEIQEIHLVDPSDLVIDVLQKKLYDSYITVPDKIKIHHSEGQKLILNDLSPKTIFIAGMGGKEIQDILIAFENRVAQGDQLVISPHRKILELREYLKHSPWRLKAEEVLFEDGQFYLMLSLTQDKGLPKVSSFGERNLWVSEIGQRYREKELRHFSCHKDVASREYCTYLEQISL